MSFRISTLKRSSRKRTRPSKTKSDLLQSLKHSTQWRPGGDTFPFHHQKKWALNQTKNSTCTNNWKTLTLLFSSTSATVTAFSRPISTEAKEEEDWETDFQIQQQIYNSALEMAAFSCASTIVCRWRIIASGFMAARTTRNPVLELCKCSLWCTVRLVDLARRV